MNITGIVLAAGLSRRMGQNKLRMVFGDKPLLMHVLDLAMAAPLGSIILVTREATLQGLDIPHRIRVVFNRHPEQGQSSSMRLGLNAAQGDGYLFFTADQPLLDKSTVMSILAHADGENIVAPIYKGIPGNPVFFPECFRQELMAVRGDVGGKGVREKHPDKTRYVEASDAAALWDVDTYEQYEYLRLLKKT